MSDEADFRGSRRLTGGEEWFWYLFAGATYVTLGIWHKWILNWLMGPIWLVGIVVVGPWLVDLVRVGRRSDPTGHTGHTDHTGRTGGNGNGRGGSDGNGSGGHPADGRGPGT
jgi:hypothetical protein